MAKIKVTPGSGNVFVDLGFEPVEAEELAAKAELATLIARTVRMRKLTQAEAAVVCGTDQATMSKVMAAKLGSITIDRLARWLVRLGKQVEITVGEAPKPRRKKAWGLRVSEREAA